MPRVGVSPAHLQANKQAQMQVQNKRFQKSGGKVHKAKEAQSVTPVVLAVLVFVVIGSGLISLFKVM